MRNVNIENLDRKALKDYIISKKLGITNFAKSLGFTQNYFSEVLREKKPKNMSLANYKYICAVLKVPEDTFIIKEVPKADEKKEGATTTVVNNMFTPEQFNALLQTLSAISDSINKGLEKIASAQQSNAVIQGKIYGEVQAISNALGVHTTTTTTTPKEEHKSTASVSVKPQYSNSFGGKK